MSEPTPRIFATVLNEKRAVRIALFAAVAHLNAGYEFHHHIGPSKGTLLTMPTAGSTLSTVQLFSTTTFAPVERPPTVPPESKTEQA